MPTNDLGLTFRAALIVAFIPLLAMVVFVPGLSGGFVLDDGFNIVKNHMLYVDEFEWRKLVYAALSFHDGNGSRPLPMLSFALDYWRAGVMEAGAFKQTNLFIHGITALALTFFFRRLLVLVGWTPRQAVWGGAILALVWAIHPLQVSSVLYIVQRMQTMATLFLVLSLWAYLGMRQQQIIGAGRGRGQGILVVIFWVLALACKEDAALLLAYTLVLEVTVLRFKAANQDVSKGLKQSYVILTLTGLLAYVFVVIPHYWSWDSYGTRDFSTPERLMTQARVLVMYLGQIIFPWPDTMTFLYDDYPVSRSLWQPWTTLPAIGVVISLVFIAWKLRFRRPLLSFGLLLFFAGHFITSNVIALELVFEHRNHLPLIGIVLVVGDLCMLAWKRWMPGRKVAGVIPLAIILLLGAATVSRAYTWGDTVRHGEKMVELLPESNRAWMQLSSAYFELYNETGDDGYLAKAVDVIESGLENVASPTLASNLVIYKSLLGTVSASDWEQYYNVLRSVPATWHDRFVIWTQMNNVERGFALDSARVIEGVEIVASKTSFKKDEYLRIAIFIYKNGDPEHSLPFFLKYARHASAGDPGVAKIIGQLKDEGRNDWAEKMRKVEKRD